MDVIQATEEIKDNKDQCNYSNPLRINAIGNSIQSNDPVNLNPNIPNLPFLPPIKSFYEYTLVLDLDETLIHYFMVNESEGTFVVRPGCD